MWGLGGTWRAGQGADTVCRRREKQNRRPAGNPLSQCHHPVSAPQYNNNAFEPTHNTVCGVQPGLALMPHRQGRPTTPSPMPSSASWTCLVLTRALSATGIRVLTPHTCTQLEKGRRSASPSSSPPPHPLQLQTPGGPARPPTPRRACSAPRNPYHHTLGPRAFAAHVRHISFPLHSP